MFYYFAFLVLLRNFIICALKLQAVKEWISYQSLKNSRLLKRRKEKKIWSSKFFFLITSYEVNTSKQWCWRNSIECQVSKNFEAVSNFLNGLPHSFVGYLYSEFATIGIRSTVHICSFTFLWDHSYSFVKYKTGLRHVKGR